MNSNYRTGIFEIFIYICITIFLLGSLALINMAITMKKLSFAYFPLVIILGVPFIYIIKSLFESGFIALKRDVKNKQYESYLIFKYSEEEWIPFINTLIKNKKTRTIKYVSVLLFVTIIFYISGIIYPKEDVLFAFFLLCLSGTILIAISYYMYTIKPLRDSLHETMREIHFYKECIIIKSNYYLLKPFKGNKENIRTSFSIEKKLDQKHLYFKEEIINGEDYPVIKETYILIPKEEHKNQRKIRNLVFKNEMAI